MKAWKKTIALSNQRFARGQLASALTLYNTAKLQAEELFYHWPDADEAVSALVVTHLNIADLHNKQGAADLAKQTLEQVHQMLLRELRTKDAGGPRYKAIYHGSLKTHLAMMAHDRCYFSSLLH